MTWPSRSAACSTVVPFFTTTARSSMRRATSSGPAAGSSTGGAAAAGPGFSGAGGAGGVGSGMRPLLHGEAAEGAALLRDVIVELGAELGDVRLHRPGDRLAKGADGIPLHLLRDVDQQIR